MLTTSTLPIPEIDDTSNRGRPPRYPLATMAVGLSFLIPPGDKTLPRMRDYLQRRSRALKKVFRCAMLEDGSIQVWRES